MARRILNYCPICGAKLKLQPRKVEHVFRSTVKKVFHQVWVCLRCKISVRVSDFTRYLKASRARS